LLGVWSNAETLEKCRDELEEVIEGWLIVGFQQGHEIPIVDGIDLNAKK